MTTNYQIAKDWISMAINDANTSLNNYESLNHYASFYFSQQSNEKLCKSLLLFLGKQFKKTHFPSIILRHLIEEKKIQDRKIQDLIQSVIDQTIVLEREREIPRYGIEENNRIIKPQQLYSEQDALTALQITAKNFEAYIQIVEDLSKKKIFDQITLELNLFIKKVNDL